METELQRLYEQLDKLLKSDLAVLTKEARPLVYDIKDYTKDIQELKTLINTLTKNSQDRVIKLLEENAKLTNKVEKLSHEIEYHEREYERESHSWSS